MILHTPRSITRLEVEDTVYLLLLLSTYQLRIQNYNVEAAAAILKRRQIFKLISRYHPFILNAATVVQDLKTMKLEMQ